jgi:hypothetical protein
LVSKSKRAKRKAAAQKRSAEAAAPAASVAAVAEKPEQVESAPEGSASAWAPWKVRLQALGLRSGIYALYILGIYWILAAWFSSWGDQAWARLSLNILGFAMLGAGWYLSDPQHHKLAK